MPGFFSHAPDSLTRDFFNRYLTHSDALPLQSLSKRTESLIKSLPSYKAVIDLQQVLTQMGKKFSKQLNSNLKDLYSTLVKAYAADLASPFVSKLNPLTVEYCVPDERIIKEADIALMLRTAPHFCAADKTKAGEMLIFVLEERLFTIATALIRNGAEVCYYEDLKNDAFSICASTGNTELLKELLVRDTKLPNSPLSALMVAALNAKPECIELLLPVSHVNQQAEQDGATALMFCMASAKQETEEQYLECAQKILPLSDLSLKTRPIYGSKTAYDMAKEKGLPKMVAAIEAHMAPKLSLNRRSF